jgi:peptidoglycan/LPS O-acetylase OafA/YrhL
MALILFVVYLGFSLKRFDTAVYAANLQALLSPAFVKQVLTLWYISMLVVFYIIFGLMMFTVRSNAGLSIVSAIVFAMSYFAHSRWGLFDARFFQYYFIFLAGVFFCRFEGFREGVFRFNSAIKVVLAILSIFPLQWILENSKTEGAYFLVVVDVFILAWILLSLTIFRTRIGGWQIWVWLSTASYFTYLIHRPLWRFMDSILGLEANMGTVCVHLTFGALAALILGYYLQRGYDRLLSLLRLK